MSMREYFDKPTNKNGKADSLFLLFYIQFAIYLYSTPTDESAEKSN